MVQGPSDQKTSFNSEKKKKPTQEVKSKKFPYLFAVFDIDGAHETSCLNQPELFAPAKVFCTCKNARNIISNCLHLSLGKYM